MKAWKTFLALCLALTMMLSLAACTGSSEPTTPSTEPSGEVTPFYPTG